ncbi:MAG: hypothetical protein K2L46_07195 [Paramuribaculum sp.]|nr:hypothetical protein [Paramuribaculum sp.]MDE6489049.1 hypothetical protein [Paramuribaculum sp.]
MKKNTDTFELKRFGETVRKYAGEHWRSLAMKAGVMTGIFIIATIFIVVNTRNYFEAVNSYYSFYGEDPSLDIFWFLLQAAFILCGVISASMTFGDLSTKETRLNELTVPAAQSEKFLTRWLFYVPGFVVVFTVAAAVSEMLRFGLLSAVVECPEKVRLLNPAYMMTDSDGISTECQLTVLSFLCLQSLFMLGSIVWHKASFVKTFLALGLIASAYFFIGYFTVVLLDLSPESRFPLPKNAMLIVAYCLTAFIVVFCYAVAWIRYKEMEIINRW